MSKNNIKYSKPAFITKTQQEYNEWLQRKARSVRRRDRQNCPNNKIKPTAEYKKIYTKRFGEAMGEIFTPAKSLIGDY